MSEKSKIELYLLNTFVQIIGIPSPCIMLLWVPGETLGGQRIVSLIVNNKKDNANGFRNTSVTQNTNTYIY